MATKRGSTKKSATKKSAKKATKKSAKKPSKKAGAGFPPPPIVRCVEACIAQFRACLAKGVDFNTCELRLQRCIRRCVGVSAESGPGE
jgi:hypothetical protein